MAGNVISLGSLWESTRDSRDRGQEITEKEIKTRKEEALKKEELKVSLDIFNNEKDEIKELLTKAGIRTSLYFPFKTRRNNEGELEFIPKNIFKMKKDSKKCRKQLEEALKNNKISEEEFDLLNNDLNDMLKEFGLDEEKEEEKDITQDEVDALFDTFNLGITDNLEGVVASIGENSFDKMCEEFDDMDLNERKDSLTRMNSLVNRKLKVAGDIQFTNDKNLEFENSFIKGGYLLSEKAIEENSLRSIVKEMVEKSMVRKLMIDKNQTLNPKERRALVEKIMKERKLTTQKMRENPGLMRKYIG